MNRNAYMPGSRDDSWFGFFSHSVIWLLFAAAGLLLMWFVAVVSDVTQRGEQRRLQQRTSGSMLLTDDVQRQGGIGAAVLSASSETPAGR